MRGAASRRLGLVIAAVLVTLLVIVVPAPAAPVTATVPYSNVAVADAELDGNPATGTWTGAATWTIPMENGAATPYSSATLYAKHDGTYVYFRVDGKIDVPWTSSTGNHFWFGIVFTSAATGHHSGWQDGVFFGEDAYTSAPPLVAVDTHGGGQPPTKDTVQDDLGRMAASGTAAPYSFTAEWKRKLNTGDSNDLTFLADGTTSYYFYATSDSNGGGSGGGAVNHRVTTNDNVIRFAQVVAGDTTPPTVAITAPANAAVVNGVVTVTATATDNVGVAKVEFYADATLLGTSIAAPYSQAWDTGTYAQGSHQLSAKAFDVANNNATSTITVTVDHTARSLTITSPSNNSYPRGTATISATATDPGGVSRVEFYVDAVLLGSDMTAPYSQTWDTSTSAEGSRQIRARAYFAAGGTLNATIRVVVDRTPPRAVAGPPRTVPALTTVTFNGSMSSDANGIANWTWTFTDGGPQTLYRAAPSYRFARIGAFRVNLSVADPAGNRGDDTTWVNVTAPDTTPPARLSAPVVVTGGPGATGVTWSASDAADLAGYLLLRAAAENGSFLRLNEQPVTNTSYVDRGLEPGQRYYYEVIAVDVSGNPSAPSPTANGIAGLEAPVPFDWLSIRWALVPLSVALVFSLLALSASREERRRMRQPPGRAPPVPPEVGP